LKRPIAEIMELSVLELDLWSAWIKKEQDVTNRQMRRMKSRGNTTKNRS
jgi:hypothetical protein